MTLTITDANIFIDLFEIELLPLLFDLELTIYTTKEVYLECDEDQQKQLDTFIEKEQIHIYTLTHDEVKELDDLSFSRRLSFSDQTILWLAHKKECMVLTGDQMIRKWCLNQSLEVHGILWVLEQFTDKDLLSPTLAIAKLTALMDINSWLPVDECETLLEKWEEK